MASHRRILNQSTGMYTDYDSARQMVEDWCACRWVDRDTIESLSAEESRLARIQQAAEREPLPLYEIPGVQYKGPAPQNHEFMLMEGFLNQREVIRAAHKFVAEAEWPPRALVDATLARLETA